MIENFPAGSRSAAGEVLHSTHQTYRPDIDGLRAIAILSVVIFHFFPTTLHGGFVGVDIFFVISGFLISSIIFKSLEHQSFSFLEFYAHRVRRIFPSLLVVVFACLVFGWWVLLADEYTQLGKHIAGSSVFVQNIILTKESGYFDNASELKPLLHLWSLAIEEQYYLFFPFFTWILWRFREHVISILTIFLLASFALNIINIESDPINTFFMPHTRVWELLVGGVLAYFKIFTPRFGASWLGPIEARNSLVSAFASLSQNQISAYKRNWCASIGLISILLAIIFLHPGNLFPSGWALFPTLGTALLIYAGPNAWINRSLLSSRSLTLIGLISYPLYLWHWPLLSFIRIIASETPTPAIRTLALVVSILLAYLTYRWIERPIRFGRFRRFTTASLLMAMVALGCCGYIVYASDGFPSRVPEKLATNSTQLKWGKGNVENSGCRNSFPDASTLDYCVISNPLPPTVLVVGDSHSNSLFPGLSVELKNTQHNAMNLGRGGCPLLLGVEVIGKKSAHKCVEFTNETFQFLANNKTIKTVILTSRGASYISGRGFGDDPSEVSINEKLVMEGQSKTASNREVFIQSLELTLQKLLSLQKNVIFVLDVPELGFDPRRCVEIHRFQEYFTTPRDECGIEVATFKQRNLEYRNSVLQVLKKFPSVKIFDAASEICDSNWCSGTRDGRLLYRDDDHLSEFGSKLVARQLVELID